MSNERIELEDIWNATDGGRVVIESLYPQSAIGFQKRQNFRLRPASEDKSASACVFKHKNGNFWMIQDKGGADNLAKNAVQLIQAELKLEFPAALQWIAEHFAPQLINKTNGRVKTTRQPKIEKAPQSIDEIQLGFREGGKFTESELKVLGYKITQEHCDEMFLKPLDYYITAKKDNGDSWVISSTENYPIMFYDYGDWGKIYQPFGDVRFSYFGHKPDDYVFSDKKVHRLLQDAYNGKFPEFREDSNDKSCDVDERLPELVICSGGSDALNVRAAGYSVCWLNSETAPLNLATYRILSRIAQRIYVLYDQDITGIKNTNAMALTYLDIHIIQLPDDLCSFRTTKGGVCKDAKDFFMYYRTSKIKNPQRAFKDLVKMAQPLRFWTTKTDKNGNYTGFDIDNECLYGFLNANGIYCLNIPSGKRRFSFIQLHENIVQTIKEDDFQKHVNDFLVRWIKTNPVYYDKNLLNAIHRSNQVKLSSIERLKVVDLDFKTYDKDYDFLFFRNKGLKVTKDGLQTVEMAKIGKYVLDFKIVPHDFQIESPAFEIDYSSEYASLRQQLETLSPQTPEWNEIKAKFDGYPDGKRYKLSIHDSQFSLVKYLYNTGRVHWKKEEAGRQLSEEEQQEHDLHFISKVAALGYQMFRYKEAGQAYMVYCMESEVSDEGKHMGGTCKSMTLSLLQYVRNQYTRDGQSKSMDDNEKLFDGVVRGRTEHVFIDDVKESVDVHRFMPMVTGKMEVRALYSDTEIIPFEESPKLGFTSNHSIKKFDNSLRRRTWFNAFCDYYHSDDGLGKTMRSPFTEFGKNIPDDYTPDEMNKFYNFMALCLHTYLKFRCRIQPPMELIEKRNIQREITDEFIWWADEWFTEERLNINIDRQEAYDAYQLSIPEKYRGSMKPKTFKERLQLYCRYTSTKELEYVFNPEDLMRTESERKRGDIREYRAGEDVYCIHIRTIVSSSPHPQNDKSISENFDGEQGEDEEPKMPF